MSAEKFFDLAVADFEDEKRQFNGYLEAQEDMTIQVKGLRPHPQSSVLQDRFIISKYVLFSNGVDDTDLTV